MRTLHAGILLVALLGLPGALRALDVTLTPAASTNFRYKDVAGQAFAAGYINEFAYSESNVSISFDQAGKLYLSGTVHATGLKPNFAYQLKLVGRPGTSSTLEKTTNERLGLIGRWWRQYPNPGNSNDDDYNANHNNAAYSFQGYLIIGFFVTDATGAADVHVEGNNSFHVLWRVDQRPNNFTDGIPSPATLPPTAGNAAYDIALPERTVQLYGEHEPTRALPGQLEMPRAHYLCDLLLTEESFHDFGVNAGNWTAALQAPLEFDIPSGTASELPLTITRMRGLLFGRSSDRLEVAGELSLAAGTQLDQEMAVTFLGVTKEFSLSALGRDANGGGVVSVRPLRGNPGRYAYRLLLFRPAVQMSGAFTLQIKLGADNFSATVQPQIRNGTFGQTVVYHSTR